jgi:hypothetical protein
MSHQADSTYILEKLDLTDSIGLELNLKARDHLQRQHWDKALEFARRSLDLCRLRTDIRYLRSAGIAQVHLAAVLHARGSDADLKEAARLYEHSTAFFAHDRRNRSVALLGKAITRQGLGEWGAAIEAFQESLDILKGGLNRELEQETRDRLRKTIEHYDSHLSVAQRGRLHHLAAPTPSPATVPSPSMPPPPRLSPPPPPATPGFVPLGHSDSVARSLRVALIGIAVLIVCLLMIVTVGYMAYALKGSTALILSVTIAVTMAMVALIIGLSNTRSGILVNIPFQHVAVVEFNGQPRVVQSVQRFLLLPGTDRIRALVPLRTLTYGLPNVRVPLGENRQVAVKIQIRYQVLDPIRATDTVNRAPEGSPTPDGVPGEERLKKHWELQLRTDLTCVLVDLLWGQTKDSCYAYRQRIQDGLLNELARETRRWGIDIRNLSILDMS